MARFWNRPIMGEFLSPMALGGQAPWGSFFPSASKRQVLRLMGRSADKRAIFTYLTRGPVQDRGVCTAPRSPRRRPGMGSRFWGRPIDKLVADVSHLMYRRTSQQNGVQRRSWHRSDVNSRLLGDVGPGFGLSQWGWYSTIVVRQIKMHKVLDGANGRVWIPASEEPFFHSYLGHAGALDAPRGKATGPVHTRAAGYING